MIGTDTREEVAQVANWRVQGEIAKSGEDSGAFRSSVR